MISFMALLILCVLSTPAFSIANYYKSDQLPSKDIILKNLKVLQGPSSKGLGAQGSVKTILGTHHQINQSVYLLFYCYEEPKERWIFGTSNNDGCFSDVSLFRLDSGLWIMQSNISMEWIIMTSSLY